MVVALTLSAEPFKGFTLSELQYWIDSHLRNTTVAGIGMTDRQYSWYSHLVGENVRAIHGVPIVFLDAPIRVL